MCIILTCKENVRPSHELLETCFHNNPDGAGIMWIENGRVQTSKGYADEGALESVISSIPKDSPLVIHMRIATSGGVSAAVCHPFPVSNNLDFLHAEDTECDAAVAHNGIITGMHTNEKMGISDTVTFVGDYLAGMWRRDNRVTKDMRRRIINLAPGNRFAIMTKSGDVYRIGEGWESVSPGIEASNSSWRYSRRLAYGTYDPFGLGDDYDWLDYTSPDYYRDHGYSPVYRDVFDMACADCPNMATCVAYGAQCSDVADYIDECERAEQYYGGSYYDGYYSQLTFA